MSLAAINCLETETDLDDFVDEIEVLKGGGGECESSSSMPPPSPSPSASGGDDSLSTLDFNCSQSSMLTSSFLESGTSLDYSIDGGASSRKRPVAQFTTIRSCLKSSKPPLLPAATATGTATTATASTRPTGRGVRLPTIPSDRPPLTPQGSLRQMTLHSPLPSSPDPSSSSSFSFSSPRGGGGGGTTTTKSGVVIPLAVLRSPPARTKPGVVVPLAVLRSPPPRSPTTGKNGILRRGAAAFRAAPLMMETPFSPSKSPRIQGMPRYSSSSPFSKPRRQVAFDLPDEATVGSLAEEESIGFLDLGDDQYFGSADENETSFRCDDQYFKTDKRGASFVDAMQLNDSCRGMNQLSRYLDLNLNSDTDDNDNSLADDDSYALSAENGADDDDDETLEASDPLLGKSNGLSLAVQEIEQMNDSEHQHADDPAPCFVVQPLDVPSWNEDEETTSVTALDLNLNMSMNNDKNNSSSESISPTTIASFPEGAGWGEGKETLIVPKFLSESLKARATPQDLLANFGLSKEIKAFLKSGSSSSSSTNNASLSSSASTTDPRH